MHGLTQKQQEILNFIKKRVLSEGVSVSTRDISEHFKMSVTGARNHLLALRKKEVIDWQHGKYRTITVRCDTSQRYRDWYKIAKPILRKAALIILESAPTRYHEIKEQAQRLLSIQLDEDE